MDRLGVLDIDCSLLGDSLPIVPDSVSDSVREPEMLCEPESNVCDNCCDLDRVVEGGLGDSEKVFDRESSSLCDDEIDRD